MKFHSVLNQRPAVEFSTALLAGLAPDGGLYVPEEIPRFDQAFVGRLEKISLHDIAVVTLAKFIEEIPEPYLRGIVERSLNFPIPLVELDERIYLLELFHGPTLAFKDIGARFMAEALSYVLSQQHKEVTILVATSGDTGSAVAYGFYGVPHVTVYVLYPSGKISRLQEQQMTTLGGNIHAVEVDGTFDDCQRLVKQALMNRDILAARSLSTANSINLGRLLPQIVYYIWAFAQWKQRTSSQHIFPTVVVPSGNFGNLTAAIYAKWMGIPFKECIAATNANDVVPKYLRSGTFIPQHSIQTFSNAMDVGNPSNLSRLQSLYNNDVSSLRRDIKAVSISDDETLEEINQTYHRSRCILDPHTAVGVRAARTFLKSSNDTSPFIVASTAHPAKFGEVIEKAIDVEVPLPPPLLDALRRTKQSIRIPSQFEALKKLLL